MSEGLSVERETSRTPSQGSSEAMTEPTTVHHQYVTQSVVPMPWGSNGKDGLPYFNGKNISRFLSEYESFCDLYNLAIEKRKASLLRYMSEDERERIRGFEEFEGDDWEKLKKKIKKEYRSKDEEQQMLTSQYLSALSRRNRGRKEYLQQFRKAATYLIDTGAETEYSCCRMFVHGLPEHFRDKIVTKQKLDPEEPKAAVFQNCYKQAVELWEKESKSDNFAIGAGGELNYESLVQTKEIKPSANRAEERKDRQKANNRDFSASIGPASDQPAAGIANEQTETVIDKLDPMEELTRGMGALTLPVQATASAPEIAAEVLKLIQQLPSGVFPVRPGAIPDAPRTSSYRQDNRTVHFNEQGEGSRSRRGSDASWRGPLLCHFCKEEHLIRNCGIYGQLKDKGLLHINQDQRLALGPYQAGAFTPSLEIPNNLSKKGRIDFVYEKIRESGLDHRWSDPNPNDERDRSKRQQARVDGIRARFEPDDAMFEESEDEARVTATRYADDWEDDVQARLDPVKRAAREQLSRARAKQPRTGTYVANEGPSNVAARLPRENGEIIFDGINNDENDEAESRGLYNVQSRDSGAQDAVMEETQPQAAARPKRRVALHEGVTEPRDNLNRTLKKMNGPVKIANYIMDIPVGEGLQVRDLLAAGKEIRDEIFVKRNWDYDQSRDQLFHRPEPSKKPTKSAGGTANDAAVRSYVRMDIPQERATARRVYHDSSPYIFVRVKDGMEKALVDTGAEINVMSQDLMLEMGLQRAMVKPKYVSSGVGFEGQAGEKFVGMIEDLIINSGGVEAVTHVFVAPTMDPTYRLILGVPYQTASCCVVARKADGSCIVTLKDHQNGHQVRMVAADAEWDANQKMQEMLDLSHGRDLNE